jgi:hypothetical protein
MIRDDQKLRPIQCHEDCLNDIRLVCVYPAGWPQAGMRLAAPRPGFYANASVTSVAAGLDGAIGCSGSATALARMEVNSFFSKLLPRLKSIEMNRDPQLTATTFVGGLKHLPVRQSLVSADS